MPIRDVQLCLPGFWTTLKSSSSLSSGQEKWGRCTCDQVWVEENGVVSIQVCKVRIRDQVCCSWPWSLWTTSARSCMGDIPPLETPTALIVIPIPAITTAVTWINSKLMSQTLSWGYCMEQGMRNGAGGLPAFSSLPPVLPRSVIIQNQAEQRPDSAGPSAELPACSSLSWLHWWWWGRKYMGRMMDLSPPDGRLVSAMDFTGVG